MSYISFKTHALLFKSPAKPCLLVFQAGVSTNSPSSIHDKTKNGYLIDFLKLLLHCFMLTDDHLESHLLENMSLFRTDGFNLNGSGPDRVKIDGTRLNQEL